METDWLGGTGGPKSHREHRGPIRGSLVKAERTIERRQIRQWLLTDTFHLVFFFSSNIWQSFAPCIHWVANNLDKQEVPPGTGISGVRAMKKIQPWWVGKGTERREDGLAGVDLRKNSQRFKTHCTQWSPKTTENRTENTSQGIPCLF